MYICPNCGKTYEDEVAFCSACGTKVIVKPAPVEEVPYNAIKPAESFIVTLMSFLANAVQIVSAFFAAVALATSYVRVRTYSASLIPGTGSAVFALLFAMGGLGLSVVSFIFSMKNGADLKTKFNKITSMASGFLLFILSIVLLAQV